MLACTESKRYSTFCVIAQGVGIPFSKLPPRRIKEIGAKLILINNMEFVYKQVGSLALFPVGRNSVEHSVGNGEKSGGF